MDKMKEKVKGLIDKFNRLTTGSKIAFSILSIGIIVGIICLIVFINTTKYVVLYKDMDPNDAQTVMNKLSEKKIEYKVESSSIKVPEDKVSELRLELAPQLTSGSKGYEILENSDKFGMTDKERELNYKIALEGELAKNIKSLPEVKDAKVLLVMSQDGNFFKQGENAQASVRIEFIEGKSISKDQVKAIISLMTGSVKNLKKENVKLIGVVNGKTTDLSEDLFNEEETNKDISLVADKQNKYKNALEKEYVKKIISILKPKYQDGVKAAVNVDLDFDASEKTSTIWDPNNVVRSEEIEKNIDKSKDGKVSAGPVDNNMSNTYNDNNNGNVSSSHEKTTRNYEVGKVEQKTVVAPGKVKKISVSVTINDEGLSPIDKEKISSLVAGAISYDETRGDVITIEGLKFAGIDGIKAQEEAKKQLEEAKAKKQSVIFKTVGGILLGLLIIGIIIAVIMVNKKKKRKEDSSRGINMLIDDNVEPKEELQPINFEEDNQSTHVEKEIKKYASEKPDQVVEVIKAWMAEDEG